MMMRMGSLLSMLGLVLYPAAAQLSNAPAPSEVAAEVRAWRQANEHRIMDEFVELLSIPNVASDTSNIQRNAAKLVDLFGRRGFRTRLLPIANRGPVVFAQLDRSGAKRTMIFYAHYDGQPVEPTGWTDTEPFTPALRSAAIEAGGKLISFPAASAPFQDDWRIYARSASDDKAPIIALLAALDAMHARNIPIGVNLKVVLEGEEEAGSTHLEQTLLANRELLGGDLLIAADGPLHQSGRLMVTFGNRGVTSARIVIYGPVRSLHSGHYGNWAPNPAMRLAQLLATMKDANGRVLIAGFYDDVIPLGTAEKKALDQAPYNDPELLKQFGLAQADGNGEKLLALINEPSLNIDGLESGWTGPQGKTIIPDRAIATLDMRLVKNVTPEKQFERLVAHIRKQGYYVIDREPTADERAKYPRIATVIHAEKGYPATRTPMDLPVSQALLHVVDQVAEEPAVRMPVLGGSVPMYIFENLGLPVIGLPIVNFDNNQHSPNENLRIGNLWRGMEVFSALLADLNW